MENLNVRLFSVKNEALLTCNVEHAGFALAEKEPVHEANFEIKSLSGRTSVSRE